MPTLFTTGLIGGLKIRNSHISLFVWTFYFHIFEDTQQNLHIKFETKENDNWKVKGTDM